MAAENSYKLIKEMVADDYITGLLKDPAMQADSERAAEPTSWAQAAEGLDDIPQPKASGEMER